MSTGDKIALAGVLVTALGVTAAWLTVPKFSTAGRPDGEQQLAASAISEGEGSKPPAAETSSNAPTRQPSRGPHGQSEIPEVKVSTYTVSFISCVATGNALRCDANLSDESSPKGYVKVGCGVYSDTIIVDEHGVTRRSAGCSIGGISGLTEAEEWPVSNVKYRLSATFNGVDTSIHSLRLLQFDLSDGLGKAHAARFRDVPVSHR